MTLAAELEVSVRTVYRDLAVLSAAGVPVVTESGRSGGCWLIDGYRFPLRGLSPAEAEALLILGVPAALSELGLAGTASAAQDKISRTVPASAASSAPIHLDMPAWFRASDPAQAVPWLRTVASAVRKGRALQICYKGQPRVAWPLGLVNKAGTWYLVAVGDGRDAPRVFRVGRISAARELAEPVARPAGSSWRRSGRPGRRPSRRAGRGSRYGCGPRRRPWAPSRKSSVTACGTR